MTSASESIRTGRPVTRRAALGGGIAAATVAFAAGRARTAEAASAAPALGRLAVRGGDISFTLLEEAVGNRFYDRGVEAPVERILANRGASWVRLRVWVNPPAGYSDLQSTLKLALRAKRAGLKTLIDPHYSDFWADPGKQPIPASWPSDSLASVAQATRTYTRDLVRALAKQGSPADMIQIGNEVTNGMLWPWGQIYQDDGQHWADFATLVQAGVDGAQAGNPAGHQLRTMIHIDRGGDNGGTRWFFDHLFEQGIDVDVLGQSYYPMWHGSLADVQANLTDMATRYGKDIVIVETQYPWTTGNGDELANFFWNPDQLPDGDRFPPTPEGQAGFYEALRDLLTAVPGGRGAGFLAWEPEWIPGVGWEPGAGTPNDNMTLFDWSGHSLPALGAMHAPRRTR